MTADRPGDHLEAVIRSLHGKSVTVRVISGTGCAALSEEQVRAIVRDVQRQLARKRGGGGEGL